MGSGFRVWTAGEVVSASNVNNYLQEQAVMSFAGTAARSSAVASPEEGMLSYLQDTDTYQGYDGSAWVNLGTLSGNTSDSGLIHIETQTFSAVSAVEFSNDVFTSTYDNYLMVFTVTTSSNPGIRIRFKTAGSANTNNNYVTQRIAADNTTISGARQTQTYADINFGDTGKKSANTLTIFSPKLAETTIFTNESFSPYLDAYLEQYIGSFNQNTVFDSISLYVSSGTFTGKAILYGYKQ